MSYCFRQWILPLLCLILMSPALSKAEEGSQILSIAEDDETVMYGDYVEVGIQATEDVQVRFTNQVLAFGMEIQKVSETEHLLYGVPLFTEQLCFEVEAQKLKGGESSYEWICLFGENNEEVIYPKIETASLLESVKTNEHFSYKVEVDFDQPTVATTVGELPQGVTTSVDPQGNLVISGRISEVGLKDIVVKVEVPQEEISHYKQFSLEVLDQEPSYQCAPGYYYDTHLRYCVQDNGSTCGPGTFYDWNLNQCVSYRSNPSCGPGTYYDHWSNRCIRSNARRCPINYEWNRYYNSCTRLPYTCRIGQRYDYRFRACVSAYRSRVCSVGTHWNYVQQRCVVTPRVCRPGEFWGGRYCQRTRRYCGANSYYSPSRGTCVRRVNRSVCRAGTVFDHYRGTCVRREIRRTVRCGAGSRWSQQRRSCVRYDQRRVDRHPRRHRPRNPETRPKPPQRRPETRPKPPQRRPETRPKPPQRRPETRPKPPQRRPETRPKPPQRRPETRPKPPQRRPETRPRPPQRRPETRPKPPQRRPETRPNRPNRGNRGNGTCRRRPCN